MRLMLLCALLLVVGTALAVNYSGFTTKSQCEANNGFWCYRCQGIDGNSFGRDTCVESSANCTYSCSIACGAGCEYNSQCKNNLTDNSCQYSGLCSFCNCKYTEVECPKNGTIMNGVCYFGRQECSSSGCTLNTCTLGTEQICHPSKGCIAGLEDEYYEDYRCDGNKVFAKKFFHVCNATICEFSESDVLIDECDSGCSDGKCLEGLCWKNGVGFDCNLLDGFYGDRYCVGNDVYKGYRNYLCQNGECTYVPQEVKQESCSYCEDGKCTTPAVIEPPKTNNTIVKPADKPLVYPQRTVNVGKRIHNGLLFGHSDLTIETLRGADGRINLIIFDTNKFGTLSIVSDGKTLFTGKPNRGSMSIPFENIGSTIRFTTSSSGLLFFAPAVYDIKYVIVEYNK